MMRVEEKYRKLTKLLIEKGLTITTMESATAGEIASLITDTEGSSAVLKGAFITYSNEAKILQGVPAATIGQFGVYSKETARDMAAACRKAYGSDLAIGLTGTFGNIDPANRDSVPGRIYYAVACGDEIRAYAAELSPQPDRHAYKLAAAELAADAVLTLLGE